MNAAARLVHQGVISRHLVFTYFLTRQQIVFTILAAAILLSGLSVIYVTHLTREINAAYQQNVVHQNRLQIERSQLLLERSTWMMQARIQQAAEKNLGMMVPDQKSVVVIQE